MLVTLQNNETEILKISKTNLKIIQVYMSTTEYKYKYLLIKFYLELEQFLHLTKLHARSILMVDMNVKFGSV